MTTSGGGPRGLAADPSSVEMPEGTTKQMMVRLMSAPSAMVPVKVSSDNPDVTVEPGELQFTPENWNTGQPVTVHGKEDADTDDETATVRLFVPQGGQGGEASTPDYSALRDTRRWTWAM